MNLPTFNAVLKSKTDKAGFCPIIINVTFNRKITPVTTGFKAHPTNFDKLSLIGKADPNSLYKNRAIKQQIADLERLFIRFVEDQGTITPEAVKAIVRGEKVVIGKPFKSIVEEVKRIYIGKLDNATIISWGKMVNRIEAYRPGVTLSSMTETFFIGYEAERKRLKDSHNTIWADFKMMNSVFNKAVKHRIMSQNPLAGYSRPKYKEVVKVYLSEEEVGLIEEYADKGRSEPLRNVAGWFVFACRSGLRYRDLAGWDADTHISGGRLYFSDQKEENPHFIPIRPDLQRAIDRVEGSRIPSNQKCNDYIKEVAEIKGIKKNISMHTARHTFAVDFLDKGGDIKVLQLLMGHKKLATTEVYGKITDKRIEAEVKRVYGY